MYKQAIFEKPRKLWMAHDVWKLWWLKSTSRDQYLGCLQASAKLPSILQTGDQVTFQAKPTTKLVKLMKAYCERQGIDYASVVFSYDGQRLREEQTPGEVRHFKFLLHQDIAPACDCQFAYNCLEICAKEIVQQLYADCDTSLSLLFYSLCSLTWRTMITLMYLHTRWCHFWSFCWFDSNETGPLIVIEATTWTSILTEPCCSVSCLMQVLENEYNEQLPKCQASHTESKFATSQ